MSPRMIQALRRPACYPHPCGAVEVVETHLSWVLLAGAYAYKVKKPVDLGFADFTTLARRRRFCREELRLNRRLAPQVYRDVVAITGTPAAPRAGGCGRVLDYAVRMQRFPQGALAARRLRAGGLNGAHFEALAREIAAFHARCPRAGAHAGHGEPDTVRQAMRDNFAQIAALEAAGHRELETLRRWSERRFASLRPVLQRRRREGRVRECHGDLHLGNLALLDGRLVAFDCIEFNPALRWIDTASEIAFTLMDLHQRDAAPLAHRFLDAWLEASGDHGALEVLDFFLVYRAMVRAKVAALRAAQCGPGPARTAALDDVRRHLSLARAFTRPAPPLLVITHGVAGSGKTTFAQALVERLGLVRLRSDVERKRLFGLDRGARTGSAVGGGIYGPLATRRTYAALEARAATVLQAGYGAVVDATFLPRGPRDRFARLARSMGCPFRIVVLGAPAPVLRRRIVARARAGGDASEATPAVLAAQLATVEPPAGDEPALFVTGRASAAMRRAVRALAALRRRSAIDASQCAGAAAA